MPLTSLWPSLTSHVVVYMQTIRRKEAAKIEPLDDVVRQVSTKKEKVNEYVFKQCQLNSPKAVQGRTIQEGAVGLHRVPGGDDSLVRQSHHPDRATVL